MKITAIDTLNLSRMHQPHEQWFTGQYRSVKADCVIVVIHTDEGISGIGEACAYGNPTLMKEWIDWLTPTLLGKDPRDASIVPHPNYKSWAFDCAVAGIDCAWWDLCGKIEGKRVSELLTDKPIEKIRLYASSGCRYDWRADPHQLINEALGYIADGYTALKFRIGSHWAWDGVNVDRFLGLVRELVQEVDGRLELMLDGNQRLTVDEALVIAKELDRLGFIWFEEPIPQTDIDGYVRLNASVDMPITGGEQFTTLEQFRPYIERHAYGIVQPDMGWCGISEGMRIAEMAYRHGIDCCPHSWHNGLMCIENGHFVAALPNPRVLELCMIQGPLQWEILQQKPIAGGYLELPNRPGFGVDLAEGLTERFPYIEGGYAVQVQR
jgi:L-alanine-DL-glutamate epimerase-like enolase superfamily enzyme